MKQIDWVEELENKEDWVIFDQAGSCFGLVVEISPSQEVYLIRCRCDMNKGKKATNNIKLDNIKGHYKSFTEAEDVYQKKYLE